ncbi:MAG: hypothetical protein EXR98_00815 [Gemmataceae bacterium]|nr:hypothetical protein [Gemmataceae bacterium]
MHQHFTEVQPPPVPAKPERPLRPLSSILFRMVAGFAITMLLAIAILQGRGLPLFEVAMAGATIGAGFSLLVGFTLWVLFPFQSGAAPTELTDREQPEEDAFH